MNVKGYWLLHLWPYNAMFWPVQKVFGSVRQRNGQNHSFETDLGEKDDFLLNELRKKIKNLTVKTKHSDIINCWKLLDSLISLHSSELILFMSFLALIFFSEHSSELYFIFCLRRDQRSAET